MDVKSAYLNGKLTETIYMEQPPGYIMPGQERKVCKLNVGLYGLRQAGNVWYGTLCEAMEREGFVRSRADLAVF